MLRSNLLLGVLALSAVPLAPAQEVGGMVTTSPAHGSVGPGARVRLRVPTLTQDLVGFVDALRNDTLFLAGSSLGPLAPVPLAAIERLELNVKRGSRSKDAGTGAAIGAGVGSAVGYAVGSAAEDDCSGQALCFEGLETLGATFTGVLVGGLLGAAVGAAEGGDRWMEVPVGDLRMNPEPAGPNPEVAGSKFSSEVER